MDQSLGLKLQTKVALKAGKVALNGYPGPKQALPLVNEKECGQILLPLPPEIVVNGEGGLKYVLDEAKDLPREVGRIGPHQTDGDAIDAHHRQQQGNRPGAVSRIGRSDEKEQREIRPSAQKGVDLESED